VHCIGWRPLRTAQPFCSLASMSSPPTCCSCTALECTMSLCSCNGACQPDAGIMSVVGGGRRLYGPWCIPLIWTLTTQREGSVAIVVRAVGDARLCLNCISDSRKTTGLRSVLTALEDKPKLSRPQQRCNNFACRASSSSSSPCFVKRRRTLFRSCARVVCRLALACANSFTPPDKRGSRPVLLNRSSYAAKRLNACGQQRQRHQQLACLSEVWQYGGVSTSQSANTTMQQPRWQSSGSHNVTAHCTLLQQLSQVSALGVHCACPQSRCGVWQ